MAKWEMIPRTVEGDQAYKKACVEANTKGYWLAPDGTVWKKTGKDHSALWVRRMSIPAKRYKKAYLPLSIFE